MDKIVQLKRQYIEIKRELHGDEFVNDQFKELRKAHEGDIHDLYETIYLFFVQNEQIIQHLFMMLNRSCLVFDNLVGHLYKLMSGAKSIGAEKVINAIDRTLICCRQQNLEGCLMYAQEIKEEFYRLKSKLKRLIAIEQQIIAAGGII